jgi:hypothetical protein
MAEDGKLPAHTIVGRIVMAIIAIWLVIWMLRLSGINIL